MKIVNLKYPQEYIVKVVDDLKTMKNPYSLMLSGGKSALSLYNNLSFRFDYPFPANIGMTDEIWGEKTHNSSIEFALKTCGLLGRIGWEKEKSAFFPVLGRQYSSAEAARDAYEEVLFKIAKDNNVVAVLTMDNDGAVAGIVPGCPAIDSESYVISYNDPMSDKLRITVTSKCILEFFNKVILLVDTTEKCGMFDKVFDREKSADVCPVALLKDHPDTTVYCFTDY